MKPTEMNIKLHLWSCYHLLEHTLLLEGQLSMFLPYLIYGVVILLKHILYLRKFSLIDFKYIIFILIIFQGDGYCSSHENSVNKEDPLDCITFVQEFVDKIFETFADRLVESSLVVCTDFGDYCEL